MPVTIFFCYAQEDEDLLNKLKTHLRPLRSQSLITAWYDRNISAGTKWEQEINEYLNAAQIILLLVSSDFMNSRYCYSVEMNRALERHSRGEARVIPIILRHVHWNEGPFGKLQALPTGGKPVTDLSWFSLDRAFYNVTEGIRKVVEQLSLDNPLVPTQAARSGKIARPARFILRSESGTVLQEYPLEKIEISIGRAPNSDILLSKDKLTSRRHATVHYENGQYVLRDERSANGTFVNGQQLEEIVPRVLQDGDRVGIGEHELLFHGFSVTPSVEDMPTMAVQFAPASPELTFRTRSEATDNDDEDAGVAVQDDFSTHSMDNGTAEALAQAAQAQAAPPASISKSSTPVYSPEQLRFTAFHPKEVTVGTWNTLLVYAHIEPVVEVVCTDAQRFKTELGGVPRKISVPATQLLLRETNITVVPECKGVTFNPKRFTFKWVEDWHRASFRFSAKPELAVSAGNGRINVFAGPLLVGTLKLALLFEEQDSSLPAKENNTQETANLYQQIFASYSHDDSLIVLTCRDVFKTLGFNTLIDIDTLRSGQNFSDALKRMIDAADIFQLFWSERSAKSTYVTEEWEYALRLNRGEGFVRPVYWEVPIAKPPEKLAALHFAYLPAYTFTRQQSFPT